MTANLLILGGTSEASALASAVHEAGLQGTVSLAGRVERPKRQPLPVRVGGFGGIDGLVTTLRAHAITHLVDATHPFAAQMSANAVAASAQTGVPLIALTRPGWTQVERDRWQHVDAIESAVAALDRPACRVMLAVGRMHLAAFAPNPQHFYLLRLVDPPQQLPPLPNHHTLVSRGPFTLESDVALMREHAIDLVVSKNAGGTGAYAKIEAARQLGLPVIMIDRPVLPERLEAHSVNEVMGWIHHAGSNTERGV